MSGEEFNKNREAVVEHHHHQPHQPPPPQYGTIQEASSYPPPPQYNENREAVVEHRHHQPPPQYGTFQEVSSYPPPPPVTGFPQPAPPPGAYYDPSKQQQYAHGYQTVPGYAVAEGRPPRERRLPCCGIGTGWFCFIIGFILGAIPWYIGSFILLCARIDPREKPGYIACTIAAVLATIAIIFGVTEGTDAW
ncbi:PREDICTED: 60S ribosomal protein L18a-like protein [Tarenaya hassleriana]|uniref:60S ribosomal protein L18a-like protein n=1 Tax=Tarenaya hassleriana TaxID=28532 RepID=UPI00053C8FB7|nr:PREDICTED: 60S ribosomal protein L18a-like protein [Tarenaya hassleriana]